MDYQGRADSPWDSSPPFTAVRAPRSEDAVRGVVRLS